MLLQEKEFKTGLKKGDIHPRCLLYGNDSFLRLSMRKKLLSMYEREGYFCEIYESGDTDFSALLERTGMVSLTGEQKALFIDDFESSLVPSELWDSFLEFCSDTQGGDRLVITVKDSFDAKGKSKDKRLLELFSKELCAVNILKHTGSVLRDELRAICKKEGVELSAELALYMMEICKEDMELLKNECIKLSLYVGKGKRITKENIDSICSKREDANIYNLASLMLKGNIKETMEEIDILLSQKTQVIQIVSNLTLSFYGLYAANVAKAEGKSSDLASKELNEKFSWRMRNYYKDGAKFSRTALFKAFEIMCQAESELKSKSLDDRTLLEISCIKAMEALRERQ